MDADGTATIAWSRYGRGLEVASAAPGRPFGASRRLHDEEGGAEALELAAAPDGGLLLVDVEPDDVRLYERAPGERVLRAGPVYREPGRAAAGLAPRGGPGAGRRRGRGVVPVGVRRGRHGPAASGGLPAAGSPSRSRSPVSGASRRQRRRRRRRPAARGRRRRATAARSWAGWRRGRATGATSSSTRGSRRGPSPVASSRRSRSAARAGPPTPWRRSRRRGRCCGSTTGRNRGRGVTTIRSATGACTAPSRACRRRRSRPSRSSPCPPPRSGSTSRTRSWCGRAARRPATCAPSPHRRTRRSPPPGSSARGRPPCGSPRAATARSPRRDGAPLSVLVRATAPGGAVHAEQRIEVPLRRAFTPPPEPPRDVRVVRRDGLVTLTFRTERPARREQFVARAFEGEGDHLGRSSTASTGRGGSGSR